MGQAIVFRGLPTTALCQSRGGGVVQVLGAGIRVLRAEMVRFGEGLVQDAHGMTHLPLDDAELFANQAVFMAQ